MRVQRNVTRAARLTAVTVALGVASAGVVTGVGSAQPGTPADDGAEVEVAQSGDAPQSPDGAQSGQPVAANQPAATDRAADEGTPQANDASDPEPGVPYVQNFAINLKRGVSSDQFNSAVAAVRDTGAVILQQYPQIDSFFAQTADRNFAEHVRTTLADKKVPLTNVGPTRYAKVKGDEIVVEAAQDSAPSGQSGTSTRMTGRSQLEKNSELDQEYTPDPQSEKAWGLKAVRADQAAAVDVMLAPVTVGVIDSGIDGTHEDLKDQIDHSKSVGCSHNGIPDTSFEAWQPSPTSGSDHGTHVAGTIAAAHNGIGVDGVAPHAKLAAIKAGNADGLFYPEYVTCSFIWAAEHDIAVTNNSYFTDPWEHWLPTEENQAAGLEAVTRAVAYSHDHDVLNISAAGNDDRDIDNATTDSGSPNDVAGAAIENRSSVGGVDLPSDLSGVVVVSSVEKPKGSDPLDGPFIRSYFSNYGANAIDVAAPGSRIFSTIPLGFDWWDKTALYASKSGTSMASPHAAGVAALLRSVNPTLSADQAANLLREQAGGRYTVLADPNNAEAPDGKEYRGTGLVDALAAVTVNQPQPTVAGVEYWDSESQSWKAIADAKVAPQGEYVRIRAAVSGPYTKAALRVNGRSVATLDGTGAFDSQVAFLEAELKVAQAFTADRKLNVAVDAWGRNNDARADDDVTVAVQGTLDTTRKHDEQNKQPAAYSAKPSVARTGASVPAMALAGLALAGAGALTASRRMTRS